MDDVKKKDILNYIAFEAWSWFITSNTLHTGRLGLPRMAVNYMMHDFHWLPDGLHQIRIRCEQSKYETHMTH